MSVKSEVNGKSYSTCPKCVTLDTMNPAVKVMEYAVRGPLVIRASEIEKELEQVRKCFLSHRRKHAQVAVSSSCAGRNSRQF